MSPPIQVLDIPDHLRPFADDVLDGLSKAQKELSCKYFYDQRGSELFNVICELDEYYPTRTETALLETHGAEIAEILGPGVCLIEYGCGSLVKTRCLLDAMQDPALFIPIDISEDHLIRSAKALADDYQDLKVIPVVADFTDPVEFPEEAKKDCTGKRVGFFPGSTIGNFERDRAVQFLKVVAGQVGEGGGLLVGADLKKDENVLIRAYDDSEGITAAFNFNVMERINKELGGDFDISGFRHLARYNREHGRVEMHLLSLKEQTAKILGRAFRFREGETIHTENSHKYTLEEFRDLAQAAGFSTVKTWVDEDDLFSVHYLTVD
ncbi:MAG: L-histidine N(alpha)-methyltransferase [Rhodospirillales bacterium]|nr:L-histidine N(alpha)-methyltransferase [Rhodospirillales bacterium]